MSLNMALEVQLPSSGDELEKIDFPIHLLLEHPALFSQFVKSWTSMEHDSNWEPKVFHFIKR